MFTHHTGRGGVLLCLCLTACQTYQASPLAPETTLQETVARRASVAAESLTLFHAGGIMATHNPDVREARAEYNATRRWADVAKPLPNPSLSVAPTRLSSASPSTGFELSLGWALPLRGTRRLTNERKALEADAAKIHVAGVERTHYLGLRRDLMAVHAARARVAARARLRDEAQRTTDVVKRLAEAGSGTALDLHAAQLEHVRREGDVVAAQAATQVSLLALSARLGIAVRPWQLDELPPLPQKVPSEAALHALFLEHDSQLAHRRAMYRVAEKDVRLELAQQFPELHLGPLLEREGGENKWGLEIGIEIPLFDRNQTGIAAARATRERQRAQFGEAVARGIDAIAAARHAVLAQQQRFQFLETRVAPLAQRSVDLVSRALESGQADALRLLDALRRRGEVELERIDARAALYGAWADLEAACGAPLLLFPNAPESLSAKPQTNGETK